MKKTIISIFAFVLLTSPLLMWAENDSSEPKMIREEHREMVGDWQEKRSSWQEARENWQKSRPENRFEMKRHMAEAFWNRFDFVGNGLQKLHDRIQAWLDKVADEIDETLAQAALDDAQEDIDAIKVKAAEIKAILESEVLEADKPAKREEVKALLEEVKVLVKSAHESLKEAFRSIKSELHEARENSLD